MDRIQMDVYYDYAWPYVYNAAVWLDNVKNAYRGDLTITWKNFQLEQANNKEAEEWNVWDLPDHHDARSLVAAMAAEAARLQGD